MLPKISIIVPVYNVEAYLRQCLESLVGQTMGDIEIVIVDDGSTDSSADIIAEFAQNDPRLRVITKHNSGYGDSMNQGIAASAAPWIAICEPDDYVEPDFCERLYEAAMRYEDAGRPVDIVKAAYYREVVHEDGSMETVPCFYLGKVNPPKQPFAIKDCPQILVYHPSIWTCLYRRGFLEGERIAFMSIPGAGWADNPFFVETMVSASSISYLDQPLYHYREFEDGSASHMKDWRIVVDRWFDILEVLERRGVTDPGVLECNYARGCAYIDMLDADFAADPEAKAAAQRIVDSIDYDAVMRSRYLIHEYKKVLRRHYSFGCRLRKRLLTGER